MKEIAQPIFYGLLIELISLSISYIFKERRLIAILVLVVGTILAGIVAFVPLPMQTQIRTSSVYDDFSDSKFDGDINMEKWAKVFDDGCLGYQQNGSVFVTTNTKNNETLLCRFLIRNPKWVQGSNLSIFEAKIKISSDHNGEFVAEVLELVTSDGWNLSCGIEAGREGPEVVLDVEETAEGVVHKSTPILYDRWYRIRLEIDNATMTFACYIDDNFFASVVSKIADDLRASSFQRNILGLRSANAFATTSFDDVSISR